MKEGVGRVTPPNHLGFFLGGGLLALLSPSRGHSGHPALPLEVYKLCFGICGVQQGEKGMLGVTFCLCAQVLHHGSWGSLGSSGSVQKAGE